MMDRKLRLSSDMLFLLDKHFGILYDIGRLLSFPSYNLERPAPKGRISIMRNFTQRDFDKAVETWRAERDNSAMDAFVKLNIDPPRRIKGFLMRLFKKRVIDHG